MVGMMSQTTQSLPEYLAEKFAALNIPKNWGMRFSIPITVFPDIDYYRAEDYPKIEHEHRIYKDPATRDITVIRPDKTGNYNYSTMLRIR